MEIVRWLGLIFIPFILVIRHYAKTKSHPCTLKTLIIIFFILFVAWVMLMFKSNQLQ